MAAFFFVELSFVSDTFIACNTGKDDVSWTRNVDRLSVPNSPTHKTCETVGVEAKRIRDEDQAREQWKNIVEICSQVSCD